MLSNKNIFYGEVKDVNDPLGIGRIRVEPNIELITYVYKKLGTGDANLNQGNFSCPKYDTTGLVKKKTVSDVCYGCDVP